MSEKTKENTITILSSMTTFLLGVLITTLWLKSDVEVTKKQCDLNSQAITELKVELKELTSKITDIHIEVVQKKND